MSTTVVLMIIMLLTKAVSFLKDSILVSMYGASSVSDAFLVAVAIPTVLISGVMTALFTSYIPMYKDIKKNNSKYLGEYHSSLLCMVCALSLFVIVVYFIFNDAIIKLFAVGFDDATFNLTKQMSTILIFNTIPMGISYIFQGFLQANNRFYHVALSGIILNLIITVGILISTKTSIMVMPISVVVAYLFYIVYYGIPSFKSGFRMSKKIDLKNEVILKTVEMIIPIFLGQIVFEINSIVDKSTASLLAPGDVTIMDYSFKLMAIAYSIFANPIATFLYPKLSEYAVNNKEKEMSEFAMKGIDWLLLLIVPASIGVFILSESIVSVLFFHGAFTKESVIKTSDTLRVYSLSIIPIAIRIIVEKLFYAKKMPKAPMINSLLGILVNIVLDICLVNRFKHLGLAFATSVSSFITGIVFLYRLKKCCGSFEIKRVVLGLIKYFLCSIPMMGVLLILDQYIILNKGTILYILLAVSLGSVVYFLSLIVIKDKYVMSIIKNCKSKIIKL